MEAGISFMARESRDAHQAGDPCGSQKLQQHILAPFLKNFFSRFQDDSAQDFVFLEPVMHLVYLFQRKGFTHEGFDFLGGY